AMSKTAMGIAVIVLMALLSSVAIGKGGGHGGGGHGGGHGGHGAGHFGGGHGFGHAHFGGGHHGGARHAISRSYSRGSFHSNRSFAGRNGANFNQIRHAAVGSASVRSAMN